MTALITLVVSVFIILIVIGAWQDAFSGRYHRRDHPRHKAWADSVDDSPED